MHQHKNPSLRRMMRRVSVSLCPWGLFRPTFFQFSYFLYQTSCEVLRVSLFFFEDSKIGDRLISMPFSQTLCVQSLTCGSNAYITWIVCKFSWSDVRLADTICNKFIILIFSLRHEKPHIDTLKYNKLCTELPPYVIAITNSAVLYTNTYHRNYVFLAIAVLYK